MTDETSIILLSKEDILKKHYRISFEIERWYRIRRFLIDQIEKRKTQNAHHSIYTNFKSIGTHTVYHTVLFGKNLQKPSPKTWPITFRECIKTMFFYELYESGHIASYEEFTKYFTFKGYDFILNPHDDRLKVDEKVWMLDRGDELTHRDIGVISRFTVKFIESVEEIYRESSESCSQRAIETLLKEIRRIKKAFSNLDSIPISPPSPPSSFRSSSSSSSSSSFSSRDYRSSSKHDRSDQYFSSFYSSMPTKRHASINRKIT